MKKIGEIGEFEGDIVVFDGVLDYNQDATGLFQQREDTKI